MSGLLVTGAGGFTGKHFCRAALDAGYEVHAVGRDLDVPGVTARDADIRDLDALTEQVGAAQPDLVVHLAAVSHVTGGSPATYYEINVIGTLNLLEALTRASRPATSVLLASSAQVYGQPKVSLLAEDVAPQPLNHYGASKLAMEHLAQTYADRLPINIVRPFNYTGVGQPNAFLVPKIVEHFAARRPVIELGNLDVYREINDVSVVVDTYLRLLSSGVRGETVNICSGIGHSPREIIDLLTEITGHRIEVVVNPAFVRANELRHLVGSNARLVALIGEQPAPTLAETLRTMLAAA